MKKIILCIVPLFITLCAYGQDTQKTLSYNELETLIPFSTENSEALVIIALSDNLKPEFKTNFSEPIDIFDRQKEGADSLYYLRFPVGEEWENRRLYVIVPTYARLVIPLKLNVKETKKFRVYDPDIHLTENCFYQFTKEAASLYQKAIYIDAKEKYLAALQCSNISPENRADVELRIANIDSVSSLITIADAYFNVLNYKAAHETYMKAFGFNKDDQYVVNKMVESQQKHGENCDINFTTAEKFFNDKENEKAIEYYEKILTQSCNQSVVANERILIAKERIADKVQKASVFSYEYAENTPIGFSIGKYKKRTNGYFTLRLNTEVFEALRDNNDSSEKPEINVSFGWTFRPVKVAPVWIFLGPGYTAVGQYVLDEEEQSNYYGYEDEEEELKLKVYHAVSPEIGLLGKIGPIALRYTYQYRFALKKEHEDWIEKQRHVFGIGFCF